MDAGIFDGHSGAALEFPVLLDKIASLARSRAGAAMSAALRPSCHPPTVERRLKRLSFLTAMLEKTPAPDLSGIDESAPLLDRLKVESAYLLPGELLQMADFLNSAESASRFLSAAGEEAPDPHPESGQREVERLAGRLIPLPQMAKELRRTVGAGNSINSSASPLLARIREDIARSRQQLRQKLGALLQRGDLAGAFSDQIITQRADRFVVPVKTDAKSRVAGIIHDASSSGATCFVEPLEAVESNNQLALLLRREQEEEERILREIASRLRREITLLTDDRLCLIKLDCLLAQAAFCLRLECSSPCLEAKGEIDLIQARHPLLAWRYAAQAGRPAMPIAIKVKPDKRILVLSGANAGGKTAALKTLGLLTLMAMCGMRIPCAEGSRVIIFRRILAEIGDEQSLDLALSTFTAHAGRLAWMIKQADENSLLLIDEIGGGTDPAEGAALALAVLKWLERAGAYVLCTTHYHRLKAYAAMDGQAENVSVSFHPQGNAPDYRLRYGLAGLSGALEVSAGLGFPSELIAMARRETDGSEIRAQALLHQAHAAKDKAGEELRQAASLSLAAAKEREEAAALLKSARQRQAGALAEGKRKVRELIRRFEQRLEKTLTRIETAREEGENIPLGRARQDLYQARREYQKELEETLAPAPEEPRLKTEGGWQSGQRVRLAHLNQEGILLETPRPDQELLPVAVGVKGVRVMARREQLEHLERGGDKESPAPSAPAQLPVSVQAQAGEGRALNLVGLRVDDALEKLDKALDEAILAGRGQVEIIHGQGTGQLKKAVREYLLLHPFVAGYQAPTRWAGATIAQLKE
ncbi:MAG: Smr/MutS family protein [Desulfarculales bacterium]|jgi:DNA mismatch repair protein MutS2|nr:Smr/MutS family protein [Desulfarculales bacterium]